MQHHGIPFDHKYTFPYIDTVILNIWNVCELACILLYKLHFDLCIFDILKNSLCN